MPKCLFGYVCYAWCFQDIIALYSVLSVVVLVLFWIAYA